MRYANLAFFIASAMLGFTLSVALMSQLPFGIFGVENVHIEAGIDLLEKENATFNASTYYAKIALEDLLLWKDAIDYVMAVVCALIVVMPALATIWVAERKLFDRRVGRGWKMMSWMVALGSLVVAIYPAPVYIVPYIAACSLLIGGYIVTYQWPKKPKQNAVHAFYSQP